MIAGFIEKRARRFAHLPRDVQIEIAKVDLARSNQWLVGTYIASIPALGLMFAFMRASSEMPQFKPLLLLGMVMSAFVVATGPIACLNTRSDAIKRLAELFPVPTAGATPSSKISDPT